jgi:hypothetical protein
MLACTEVWILGDYSSHAHVKSSLKYLIPYCRLKIFGSYAILGKLLELYLTSSDKAFYRCI